VGKAFQPGDRDLRPDVALPSEADQPSGGDEEKNGGESPDLRQPV